MYYMGICTLRPQAMQERESTMHLGICSYNGVERVVLVLDRMATLMPTIR